MLPVINMQFPLRHPSLWQKDIFPRNLNKYWQFLYSKISKHLLANLPVQSWQFFYKHWYLSKRWDFISATAGLCSSQEPNLHCPQLQGSIYFTVKVKRLFWTGSIPSSSVWPSVTCISFLSHSCLAETNIQLAKNRKQIHNHFPKLMLVITRKQSLTNGVFASNRGTAGGNSLDY